MTSRVDEPSCLVRSITWAYRGGRCAGGERRQSWWSGGEVKLEGVEVSKPSRKVMTGVREVRGQGY